MSVLVLVEHNQQAVKPATLSVITAAAEISEEIELLVAGYQCQAVAQALTKIPGIKKIWLADHLNYQHFLAESVAPLIEQVLTPEVTHLLAPATTFGKNILPRVAAKKDVPQISDVIGIVNKNTYRRPIYAGNAIETVQTLTDFQVLTIRTTAFAKVEIANNTAPIVTVDFAIKNDQSEFVRQELHVGDRPELCSAEVVVSGGRGLQSKENFERLMKIADRLKAAMGASRAAVDSGMAPNDCQVGQTGQVVAPKLYFAVGISGAIQHLAGMKDSKIIVAINKDPEAPIFQIADYALIGDINDVLPQWESVLTEMGY